jgi:hypothetical protein
MAAGPTVAFMAAASADHRAFAACELITTRRSLVNKSKHETFLPQLLRALNWSGHGQTGLMSRIDTHLVPTIHAGQREKHSTRLQSVRKRRKASRANPNDCDGHRQADTHRTTKHDHDISKQTVS